MRVKIAGNKSFKQIGKAIRRRPRMKYLHVCARREGCLLLMFADRTIEIDANVEEFGSVEVEKTAFGRIFDAFQRHLPVDIWTEGFEIKLRQGNFLSSMVSLPKINDDEFNGAATRRVRKIFQEARMDLINRRMAATESLQLPIDDEVNCYEVVEGE